MFRTGPSQATPSDVLIATPRSFLLSSARSSLARDLGIAKGAKSYFGVPFVTSELSEPLVPNDSTPVRRPCGRPSAFAVRPGLARARPGGEPTGLWLYGRA